MKSAIILLFVPIILVIIIPMYVADGSSNGDKINCYERGLRDGEEYPFNQNTYDDCGDDYYRGFIKGCMTSCCNY